MSRGRLRWGWLLLILPAIFGLARLRFDVEVLNLLPDKLPAVHGLKLYQQHFTNGRELIITLRAADADAAESAAHLLANYLRAESNLIASVDWQPPLQEHPEQAAEFIAYLWLNQPTEEFARLTNRLALGKLDQGLRTTREQLTTTLSPVDILRSSYDPFSLSRLPETGLSGEPASGPRNEEFASPDGTFRILFVETPSQMSNYHACAAWLHSVKAAVNRCRKSLEWPKNVTVRFTGAPAFLTEVAGGMERDIRASVLCSLTLIAVLFWWAHLSWRPLVCLLVVLGLIVAAALGFGGLIFVKLNAVSLGFAAILAGLAVDYGMVLYQEWVSSPHLCARDLRRIHAPGIVWSAVTTASAFGLLNFVGLPGLSQLGSLVAVGVLLAAILMLYVLPPLVLSVYTGSSKPHISRKSQIVNSPATKNSTLAPITTAIIACLASVVLWRSWPSANHSAAPLQPRHSSAQIALDEVVSELNHHGEPLLLVVSGRDETDVAQRLDAVDAHFSQALKNGEVSAYKLPTALWPHPERQRVNLAAAVALTMRAEAMEVAAIQAGFTKNALALTEKMFRAWKSVAAETGVIWPANPTGQSMLKRAVASDGNNWFATGMIYPPTNEFSIASLAKLDPELPNVWLTAWPVLGDVLLKHVERRLAWVAAFIVVIIGLCLRLTFRRWMEVGLSLATLVFSLLVLLALMSLVGWSWNLMNLMAVPIMLGAGVDYTIHIQLALRRHSGDLAAVRRITGRAVLLCAATTVAGFGSSALCSNAGLASLGIVCATGIATVCLVATLLLPAWWRSMVSRASSAEGRELNSVSAARYVSSTPNDPLSIPSTSYRVEVWRLGLLAGRLLPDCACLWVSGAFATIYRWMRPRRFGVVVGNLLPVLGGDQTAAEQAARALFREFGLKIAHLWRLESGEAIDHWLAGWAGGEFYTAGQACGRGVLLVTLHLGNWEFGGALLAQRGEKLLVLTQAEPGRGLTELRQKSRARRGIETLVVGEDTFAFVEIIKRLQAGATVALLVDRPPLPTAVTVRLFGQPFQASVAAAELARASGCVILPTFVVRTPQGYHAEILPEIIYDRAAIGDPVSRVRLTQEILRAFEPVIRNYVDQWYHFVPVWTQQEKPQAESSSEISNPNPQS